MRFLFWVVKVTRGASSRVQSLGEKTRGLNLSSPVSCWSPSFPLGLRVAGGQCPRDSGNGQKAWVLVSIVPLL